jgi:hypothetical protein
MKKKIVNIAPLIFSLGTCMEEGKNLISLRDIKEVLEEMDEYESKEYSWKYLRSFAYDNGTIDYEYTCENCGGHCSDVYDRGYKYCPYCGSKMKP